MVEQGWVDPRDAERLTNLTARRAWRTTTARRAGRDAARTLGAYQAAVTELAFLWHAARLGLTGADAAEREARLVAALRTTKAELPQTR
jgi:hypothetical protein